MRVQRNNSKCKLEEFWNVSIRLESSILYTNKGSLPWSNCRQYSAIHNRELVKAFSSPQNKNHRVSPIWRFQISLLSQFGPKINCLIQKVTHCSQALKSLSLSLSWLRKLYPNLPSQVILIFSCKLHTNKRLWFNKYLIKWVSKSNDNKSYYSIYKKKSTVLTNH